VKRIWTFYMNNVHWALKQIYYSPLGVHISPNKISYGRTIIGLLCIPLIFYKHEIWSLVFLVISLYLDHIDGVWARLFNQETRWGSYIDRTCDKLLVTPFLTYLMIFKPFGFCDNDLFFYSVYPLIVIELLSLQFSILQWILEYVGYKGVNFKDNKAKLAGKIKMLLECALLISILFFQGIKNPENLIKTLFIIGIGSTIMAIISLIGHLKTMQFKKLTNPNRSISEPSS